MLAKVNSLIILALSVCSYAANAQFVYFDKLYDFGNGNAPADGALGIIPGANGGYLFTSYSFLSNLNKSDALLIKINEQGDTIFTVRKSEENEKYFVTALSNTQDSSYVICSYVTNTLNNNKDYSLIKINLNNEIEFSKIYGDSAKNEQATHVINTNDKGFLIVGQSVVPPNDSAEMYVVKIDSAGNFVWEQKYGGNSSDGAYSAIQTQDSGYLILGFTQSFGSGGTDWYLVKTDSVGDQQWQRTYGSSENESGSGIVGLVDGNYLMSGGGGNGNARIRKINQNGDIIWQKNYSFSGSEGNYLYWAKELPDYSIIAAGLTNNSAESDAGWIIKTDSAGTLLWQRKYNKTADVELFYDFIPTDDNGFVLCGQATNVMNNSQDAWLLKVDEYGCTYPNCAVGIDENDNTKIVADIWPNPASELLNIEFQNNDNWALTLTDLNGKIVYTSSNNNKTLVTVDVSNFAEGVYVLQLVNDRSLVNKKIIVSH